MYSGCFSGRQDPLESIFLLLLLRLWGCGQGAERLVHHIHRRLAAVCLGRGSPVLRQVRPLEVVKADPITDQAPGLETVGDFVQVDRAESSAIARPKTTRIPHACYGHASFDIGDNETLLCKRVIHCQLATAHGKRRFLGPHEALPSSSLPALVPDTYVFVRRGVTRPAI